MTIQEQLDIADGSRFQKKLGEFILEHKLQIIVEIGSGVSSLFILKALEETGGQLTSIDTAMWYPYEIVHERFKPVAGKSIEKLVEVYLNYLPLHPQLILSDGCHEIKDMTYEYEFGYAMLAPGGYLVADDTSFGNNGAWESFLTNHDLNEEFFGDARIIQKPAHIEVYATEEYHKNCLELAETAERIWLEWGNKNSDITWDIRV